MVQGGTISFLVPTLAILSLPQWKCPAPEILETMSHENRTELWQIRMRELSGAIAISALFQVIVGFGGNDRAFVIQNKQIHTNVGNSALNIININ